jgi:hypothetical protein
MFGAQRDDEWERTRRKLQSGGRDRETGRTKKRPDVRRASLIAIYFFALARPLLVAFLFGAARRVAFFFGADFALARVVAFGRDALRAGAFALALAFAFGLVFVFAFVLATFTAFVTAFATLAAAFFTAVPALATVAAAAEGIDLVS